MLENRVFGQAGGETKSGRGRAGKAFLFCALVIGCVGICMICR